MEKPFSVPTTDGKRLYGVFHEPTAETSSAVILVHGLTGHMNEYLFLTFARELVKQGVAEVGVPQGPIGVKGGNGAVARAMFF